jgi:glycosyltransferase involved in cell wall biosynthesis
MDISLVVCAHNEEKEIGACLDAAIKHSRGMFREIIVVDNASIDGTAAIARSRGVRVVQEETKGLTYARAAGLDAARGELVAYIDADTRLPEGWIDIVEHTFLEFPRAASLSGPARYFDATVVQRIVMTFFWYIVAPVTYRIVGYMIYGANFVARRDALHAAGGFDHSIEFYGEDTDIARRLSKVGKTVFRTDFFIFTSARRLRQEGLIRTNTIYALNYLWPVLFGQPYHRTHSDIRA